MIKIEKLSKSFGAKQVLFDINLNIEKGKVYGFVGDNGAGKSTLFKCITGLEKYKGRILSDYSLLKNHIGYLPTQPYFFTRITGKEYLRLFCNARKINQINVDAYNIFNLPLQEYAMSYSIGMQKKLALTAVLLQKNDIYILDEPFNGIDFEGSFIILKIINKLRERDKTVFISSHIFSTLNDTCDEIFIMNRGVITEKIFKENFTAFESKIKNRVYSNEHKIDNIDF
ncbi:ATP-binding cassette domain-containing protein [uncultured Bacteroides sp.]|uniref:ABC transporter ATP-binding protein n=1 Tax=uncultured Bacteroides sp. TaxID=162156 RepID=UPI002AAB9F41|nr:ATP-binding cassette domain-containing protein [uncultured Bacteroides sp.]